MNVHRGDIVLVDFPYSDQTGRKVRPALVVQADIWNQRLDDTILALITRPQAVPGFHEAGNASLIPAYPGALATERQRGCRACLNAWR